MIQKISLGAFLLFTVVSAHQNPIKKKTCTIGAIAYTLINYSSEFSPSPGPWSAFASLGHEDSSLDYGIIKSPGHPEKKMKALE